VTSIVTRWFSTAIVLVVAAVAAAVVVRCWRREAQSAQTRLLLLAAALAALANSGGWGYAATVRLLVAMRAPWRMYKQVAIQDPSWLNIPCWACLLAAALIHSWRFRSRERRAVKGVSLWRPIFIAAAIALASLALRYANERIGIFGFLLGLDMHPSTGTPARRSLATTRPREVALPPGTDIEQLALGLTSDDEGYERTWGCGRTSQDVWCFAPEAGMPAAQKLSLNVPFVTLDVGYNFGCGVSSAGAMLCWGRDVSQGARVHTAAGVEGLDGAGMVDMCMLVGGKARCLRDAGIEEMMTPDPIAAISVGWNEGTCVITATSEVWCGRSRLDDDPWWTRIEGLSATKIETLGYRACAITLQRELVCWRQDSMLTTRVPIGQVVDVALGDSYICAITSDGRALCWGQNQWGQLGDGSTEPKAEPTQVLDIDGLERIAAMGATTCAATRDGRVFCWGRRSDR